MFTPDGLASSCQSTFLVFFSTTFYSTFFSQKTRKERERVCVSSFPSSFVLRSQGRGQLELLPFDEDSDSVEIAPGARNDCG